MESIEATSAKPSHRSRWLAIGALVIILAGWIVWRYTAPVQITLAADVNDLPFDVQMIPPIVEAHPGEMVSVIYRIHNTNVIPLEAFGRIEIDPGSANSQIQVFLTQCGGLNTFQNNLPEDYQVYFRVQPAGLFGAQKIILRHIFTRAAPPRS